VYHSREATPVIDPLECCCWHYMQPTERREQEQELEVTLGDGRCAAHLISPTNKRSMQERERLILLLLLLLLPKSYNNRNNFMELNALHVIQVYGPLASSHWDMDSSYLPYHRKHFYACQRLWHSWEARIPIHDIDVDWVEHYIER
jgi:hypothetical protein